MTPTSIALPWICRVAIAPSALAQQQPNPNGDRLIQPSDELPQPLDDDEIFITPATPAEDTPADDITPLTITQISVQGSTVFTDTDFAPILDSVTGDTTLEKLNAAIAKITQLYLDAGYLTSRAVLPSQLLGNGNVTIQVIEGSLTDIEINGLHHLHPRYVQSRLNLGIDDPFNVNDLEDELRLLNNDPNFDSLAVDLQSGDRLGTSRLVLDIDEAKPFFGTTFIDNYSPASVGSERIGATIGYRNLAGMGDVLKLGYTRTFTNGSNIWDFGYSLPLNSLNGTLGLRLVLDSNKITQSPFDALGIEGESTLYDVSFRQPLVRNPREEFALSLGYSYKNGQTFLFNNVGTPFSVGAEADGTTRTSVIRFGQDYTRRDANGAWSGRSQFNIGTGLFGSTTNDAPTPDSLFFSWLGQVVRVQQLSPKNLLIVQSDIQLSPDNLLASEGFNIGGAQTLRGYRQGARNADNGWRFSIEDRITLMENPERGTVLQVAPFFDMGMVWNNPSNPSQITNEHFLAGLGTGLIWVPLEDLTLRLDFALPLVNAGDRQDNLQDNGMYFNLSYAF
ncbi:MAG: ShlB/FhaC/HecB family hemolysin secretion/activation protein [Limnothrix sp. RL_2_0]|nr:ShlB/FhaC/HecB family hemolysin secretion/activation protein [Limnothrix sp. RL_2_0]